MTDIPDVKIGDEVTLSRQDGDEVITMEEVGSLSGRFNYEFVCVLGKRIPRVFYRDGKKLQARKYFERGIGWKNIFENRIRPLNMEILSVRNNSRENTE